jgi:hypothetical protein
MVLYCYKIVLPKYTLEKPPFPITLSASKSFAQTALGLFLIIFE